MKIRTFLTCEDVDVGQNEEQLIIKKMMRGLSAKSFPTEESIVVLITLEEPVEKPGELLLTLMNSKDKPVLQFDAPVEIKQDVLLLKLNLILPEPDEYRLKITFNGKYIGKYLFPAHVMSESEVAVSV